MVILLAVTGTLHYQNRTGLMEKTLAPRSLRVNEDNKKSQNDLPTIHYTVRERFNKVAEYSSYA